MFNYCDALGASGLPLIAMRVMTDGKCLANDRPFYLKDIRAYLVSEHNYNWEFDFALPDKYVK
jgi:hypothetical protein